MAYFGYRGYNCWYEEHGKESDPRIVVVAGEEYTASSLFGFKEVLAPGNAADYSTYRVTLMDFLGTGKSEVPRLPAEDKIKDQVLQLKALFTQAEYDSTILIALGEEGSNTALNFAQEMPQHVSRIIIDKRYQELVCKFPDLEEKIILLADSAEKRTFGGWHGYALMCVHILEGWTEKCPYCGSMMYKGTIRSFRDFPSWILEGLISFTALEETGDMFFLKDDSPEKVLNKLFNNPAYAGYMKAYVCRECGKMIADIKHLI